ncbi:UNVERIFIED_CONTAM: hypothetical protein FKN15_019560 [Acipenser sinensis]
MLNTSLHNPNVRDKPGVERFISMNRGINEGGDLPEELLRVRGGGGEERFISMNRGINEGGDLPEELLRGIQFLVENELLCHTAEEIAQFLYKGEGLNKTAIGDYLGERDDFNIRVLHAFVDLHEFTDLNLVQALRQFLWSFRLPGEAQKIDRMMEAFAQRYCHCNPGVFQSTDTCYVLSFAIIMLNTSLHNPNVRDKPGVERFISMNRGINEGGDLPEELLRNCFELYIPNNRGQLIKACKTEADGRVVEGNHNVYRISAPTQEEKDEWIKNIKSAVSVDPFYEMLAARKKRISLKKKEEQA